MTGSGSRALDGTFGFRRGTRHTDAGLALASHRSRQAVTGAPFVLSGRRRNDETQEHVYRGSSDGRLTTGSVPAHILSIASAEANPLHGPPAISDSTKGDGGRRCRDWCELSSCRIRLSRRLVV